jgi:hypothetical protein
VNETAESSDAAAIPIMSRVMGFSFHGVTRRHVRKKMPHFAGAWTK